MPDEALTTTDGTDRAEAVPPVSETEGDAHYWRERALKAETGEFRLRLSFEQVCETVVGLAKANAELGGYVVERMAENPTELEAVTMQLNATRDQRDKLQAFKGWVHNWLTDAGVPDDPNPAYTKLTGCRISSRLSHLAAMLKGPQDDGR